MKKIITAILIFVLTFSFAVTCAATERNPLEDCVVTFSKDYTYTGKGITPVPKVTYKKKKLTKDVDYTIYYKDNVNVGTATVTLVGIGSYKGSTTGIFKIKKGKQIIKANDIDATYGDAPAYASVMCSNPVTYKSSNTDVCTVNEIGSVTFVNAGKAKITIKAAGNGNVYEAKKVINVTVAKTKTSLSAFGGHVNRGATHNLNAVTSSGGKLTYKSSNKKIATVSKSGIVSAKRIGKVVITVKSAETRNYKAATKKVEVEVIKS